MSIEDIQKLAASENLPFHTVAAEVIQIAFLEALYAQKESTEVVFHGGTSIRLLHGGYRYSEDLDFAVPTLGPEQLAPILEKSAHRTRHLLSTVMGTSEVELRARPVKKENIYAWWLKVAPKSYRGKIHVKLEFGRYPVYQPRSLPVTLRNPLLSLSPITVSPSPEELFLDKIGALSGREHLKNRDFFDIWYFTAVLKPQIDYDLLVKKFKDYHTEKPLMTLEKRLKQLDASQIAATMERFLPETYRRSLNVNHYQEVIEANQKLITELLENLRTRREFR